MGRKIIEKTGAKLRLESDRSQVSAKHTVKSESSALIPPEQYGVLTLEQLKDEHAKLTFQRSFIESQPMGVEEGGKLLELDRSIRQLDDQIKSKEAALAQPPPATAAPPPPRMASPPPPPATAAPPPSATAAPPPSAKPKLAGLNELLSSIERELISQSKLSIADCIRYAEKLNSLDVREPGLIARKTALLIQIGCRILPSLWMTDVKKISFDDLETFKQQLVALERAGAFNPSDAVEIPSALHDRLDIAMETLSKEGVNFVGKKSKKNLLDKIAIAKEKLWVNRGNLTSTSYQEISLLIKAALELIDTESRGKKIPPALCTAREELLHLLTQIALVPQDLVSEKCVEINKELERKYVEGKRDTTR